MRWPPLAILIAPCLILGLASAESARAFGTVNAAHQSAEHEMITRRALGCDGAPPAAPCLEPATLDELAGVPGKAGAVGYPDLSTNFFKARAHCDNGDQPGGAALVACRDAMEANMRAAVADAAGLLDARGAIRPAQVTLGCVYAFNLKGRAKCNMLQDLGLVLHAAQDFYSHSNWVDATVDVHPAGLGNRLPAAFIGLRTFPKSPPPGLVTGCYSMWGSCGDRINHEGLNKDLGPIGPTAGSPVGPGQTARGNHGANFEHAVEAAAADTRDKLAVLGERLVATYGRTKGTRMLCAVTHDDPARAC
jgi:hypothetical protein